MSGHHALLLATKSVGLVGAWDPANKSSFVSLSNNNLTMTNASTTNYGSVKSTNSMSSGLYYIENFIDVVSGVNGGTTYNASVGVGNATASVGTFVGADANGLAYSANGNVFTNNSILATIATFASGDIIGALIDLTARTIKFNKNNGTFSSAFTLPTGNMFLMNSAIVGITSSLKAAPAYTVPTGAKYWGN